MNKKNILYFINLVFFIFTLSSKLEHKSSYPLIAGDTFRAYADFILDQDTTFNPLKVYEAAVIFVQIDYLDKFFNEYHPKLANSYILLTHRCAGDDDDNPIPGKYSKWVDEPKLIAWFSQNIDRLDHPKLKHLPIGISNHCWPQGDIATFNKALSKNGQALHSKLLYMNFAVSTYPKERNFVYNLFKDCHFCTLKKNIGLKEYLTDLQDHKFALSPRGNGLDCHRTWECLLMGTIPIVRSSSLDPLYKDLPILVIQDWQIITEEFLNEKYIEMIARNYSTEKIFVDYWLNEINECKKAFIKQFNK